MRDFIELETRLVMSKHEAKKVACVCAYERQTLIAIDATARKGYIKPILIGEKARVKKALEDHQISSDYEIIDVDSDEDAAKKAVSLVHEGYVDLIMKGYIQTSDLLKAVVNRDQGIRDKPILSHVALIEVPYQNEMYFVSDGGMNTYPSFNQKKAIIENAIEVAHYLGVDRPKVALLDAAEHTNARISASYESRDLSNLKWNNAIVEGPISLDIAVSKTNARIKNYQGKICGDADILIVPDIISGNILGKAATHFTNGIMAGIIYGAKVPIILGSRGSNEIENEYSIIVACLVAQKERLS
ncbi:phosphate acetyltransferase [Erysipelothrix larvae]|uniref:Phosphate acetyltransferase n=1 Tax=Erysipelothrix larvae TaxID=1514105 RepID=A0A0X8GZH7_9FIRM|nr:phosphate acyltransferase [Erysipelothrix larvae]AMC93104.1 phosphate acetyltransferase [Erysipelothrix larvae]